MKNRSFHFQLRKLNTPAGLRDGDGFEPLTVARIAEALYINRPHLTDVLNNKGGHGNRTRPKVIKFFRREYPEQVESLLKALNWNEAGEVIQTATSPRPSPHSAAEAERGEGEGSKQNVGYPTFRST